ncbi:MAG: hypothetical protein OXI96_02100 [Acidimicrobiaceae bacterium]|nr:hypothetical protein [Acidimicrobiaceae bacterium]
MALAISAFRVRETAIPNDPYESLFRPYLYELLQITRSSGSLGRTHERMFETQLRLWLDLLAGSGMAPKPEDSTDLFLRHTFLVVMARTVIAALLGNSSHSEIGGGFVSWVSATSQGREWTRALFTTATAFDWRARPRDVLRDMYQEVVDREHRKAFGEYYTPD